MADIKRQHQGGQSRTPLALGRAVHTQGHQGRLHGAEAQALQGGHAEQPGHGRRLGQESHGHSQQEQPRNNHPSPAKAVGPFAGHGAGQNDGERIDDKIPARVTELTGLYKQWQKRQDRAERHGHADGQKTRKDGRAAEQGRAGQPSRRGLTGGLGQERNHKETAEGQQRRQPEQLVEAAALDQGCAHYRPGRHGHIHHHAVVAHGFAAAGERGDIGDQDTRRGGEQGNPQTVEKAVGNHQRHRVGRGVQERPDTVDQRTERQPQLAVPALDQPAGCRSNHDRSQGKHPHDHADLGLAAAQLPDNKDRQNGQEQEHALKKQQRANAQHQEIAGEQGLGRVCRRLGRV